jgi:dTDP-4-amino-4,6-dideoxygalactose transaminase
VVTNDDEIAQYVRLVANHGRADKYRHQLPGRNSRLDGLQAAILDVKLRHMDDWNSRRRQVAHRYSEYFADRVEVVAQDERAQSVFHLYVVQVSDRDRIREELALEGVSTGIHYPIPLHRQPAFSRFVEGDASKMWVADRAADRIISLPMFPELTDDDVDFIAAAFVQALRA